MKKLSENIKHDSKIEKYDFHDTFEGCLTNAGLALCYALYRHHSYGVDLMCIYDSPDGDKVPHRTEFKGKNAAGPFGSLNDFLDVYDDGHFENFTIQIIYENAKITISGKDNSRVIEVSYPKAKKLNLTPILKLVETEIEEMLIAVEPHMGRFTKKGFEYKTTHITKLQSYEDAEEDGRLLKLPCKPGDTIYGIRGTGKSTGHFGAYPIKVKSLVQIIGYMEKKMFGEKVFVKLTDAQEKADQYTIRNKRRLKKYQKKDKELHI